MRLGMGGDLAFGCEVDRISWLFLVKFFLLLFCLQRHNVTEVKVLSFVLPLTYLRSYT